MTKKIKLELTWPGKEERPKLEPRIEIKDPDELHSVEGFRRAQSLYSRYECGRYHYSSDISVPASGGTEELAGEDRQGQEPHDG